MQVTRRIDIDNGRTIEVTSDPDGHVLIQVGARALPVCLSVPEAEALTQALSTASTEATINGEASP